MYSSNAHWKTVQSNKVCDIYRIEDGKLAEHWDVVEHNVQDIVPVHNNGLF